jgi:hypothetical protein
MIMPQQVEMGDDRSGFVSAPSWRVEVPLDDRVFVIMSKAESLGVLIAKKQQLKSAHRYGYRYRYANFS